MKPGVMSNKAYYIVLTLLLIGYVALFKFYQANGKLLIWCAAPLVIFFICKDAFTGSKWFEGKPAIKHSTIVQQAALPVNDDVKKGYLQLMHLLVAPAYFPVLEPAIQKLTTVDSTNEENTPLYSIADLADENEIFFIMGLDWKADLENLDWRILFALKKNFNTVLTLPAHTLWPPDSSISADGVLAAYNNTLKTKGFELGLIDTQSDEYVMLVFKKGQKAQVQAAVKLTGYQYMDITTS